MTVMADRTVRSGPERSRIKTLTQAALNADKTVEQVEPVEAIVGRIEYMVGVGETVMSPFSVTEHALRGVVGRLRNRTVR